MPTHQKYPHRRSIRLQNYDYRQAGFYFVTICTQDQKACSGKS
jgi:putative transposase